MMNTLRSFNLKGGSMNYNDLLTTNTIIYYIIVIL